LRQPLGIVVRCHRKGRMAALCLLPRKIWRSCSSRWSRDDETINALLLPAWRVVSWVTIVKSLAPASDSARWSHAGDFFAVYCVVGNIDPIIWRSRAEGAAVYECAPMAGRRIIWAFGTNLPAIRRATTNTALFGFEAFKKRSHTWIGIGRRLGMR
jgi:hypothetical protein